MHTDVLTTGKGDRGKEQGKGARGEGKGTRERGKGKGERGKGKGKRGREGNRGSSAWLVRLDGPPWSAWSAWMVRLAGPPWSARSAWLVLRPGLPGPLGWSAWMVRLVRLDGPPAGSPGWSAWAAPAWCRDGWCSLARLNEMLGRLLTSQKTNLRVLLRHPVSRQVRTVHIRTQMSNVPQHRAQCNRLPQLERRLKMPQHHLEREPLKLLTHMKMQPKSRIVLLQVDHVSKEDLTQVGSIAL